MNGIFIQTKKQRDIITKITSLIPLFKEREPELDKLHSFPFENIDDLKKIGYTALTVPKKYGGEGISLYDFALFQEKIASGCGATALGIGWHLGIMMDIHQQQSWNDMELFEWFCDEVKKGKLVNRAATEPATGSPTRGGKPQTTAKREKNSYIINGAKTFTTLSPVLDYFLVTATIDNEVGEFLIPRESDGVRIRETWDSVAMRGTASHTLILDNVEIPENYLVETRSPKTNNGWLLHIPACYLGIAQGAVDEAISFASHYQPNSLNKPIASLPSIRQQIGMIELELIQARHFLYSVAEKHDRGIDVTPELAAVKHVVTNTAISVVDKAMRIVGARSLSEKNPLWRSYLNVRAGLHNPPMDDATISLLADYALSRSKA